MSESAFKSFMPESRQAGVCLHITSLPGNRGIGEIGSGARRFVDAMRASDLGVWQFLPTGPTAYGDSPYQPLSTFAGNEMLIDIGDLGAFCLLETSETEALSELPRQYTDYGAVIPLKNELLSLAASRFPRRASSHLKSAFDAFVDRHDRTWLHDYALYRILKSRHGERPWPDWQAEFVHREQSALRRLEAEAGRQIDAIKVIQFLFDHQWHELRRYANEQGIRLFGDLPICIALDSADAWARPDLLRIDVDGRPDSVAGVPPDYFSADGQLWGNPLYAWSAHAASGYRWWIDRLRASVELSDIVRIDHFRGFEAYWSVPAGETTARNGAWEPGPGDAIFDAMHRALGALPIVAEDLGVITPEVEALRKRHNIPGMHVLQFDVTDPDFELSDVPDNAVCYTGTHDNDTTIGWFRGSPDDLRSRQEIEAAQRAALEKSGGTPETIHLDMIRAAFETRARIAIAPLQDYLGLGSEARLNTPGKSRNNWRWRVLDAQLDDKLCDNIARMVDSSGRGLAG